MRIISWNCSMAYGRKSHLLEALSPDVVVLQEVSKADIIGAETLLPPGQVPTTTKAWACSV
ncbi:hypothetical protein [Paenarthrobacter sp. NPDC090522]|uniref:hypothetical protein n=1 Tax=Paenarthrobacter sp. NPDC090522 TaxID=3364383 RepID=UPI0037F5DE8C